jgi:hypothetical protein
MARLQMEMWKKTPLVVNTQPDISRVGNDAVRELAMRSGCWLRSDSVILDEPIQIDELASRPAWLAAVMEDGYFRQYDPAAKGYAVDGAGVSVIDKTMLHALDVGANYWSLWTEAGNLARYHEARPEAFRALQTRLVWRESPGRCAFSSRRRTGRCASAAASMPAIRTPVGCARLPSSFPAISRGARSRCGRRSR